MESSNGSESKPQLEKKRLNRAPSPARPFLKDAHSRSNKPPAIGPKSPKLNKRQQPAPSAHPNRSRRSAAGAKEKPVPVKGTPKSAVPKKPPKAPQHAGVKPDSTSSPVLTQTKKGKPASSGPVSQSPIRVPTGAPLGQTDSSSDLSDCASEPLSDEHKPAPVASSDAESGTGSSDRDQLVEAAAAAAATGDQAQPGPGQKPKPSKESGTKAVTEEDLLREIEDLKSENDYLKVRISSLSQRTKGRGVRSICSGGVVVGGVWVSF